MQQGKMFFFIGLLMAVLQGGVVRRLPLGSEQKVRHLWSSHIFHPRFLLSVCHDGSTVDCAQFRHCWFSLLTSNIVSVHDILKALVNRAENPFLFFQIPWSITLCDLNCFCGADAKQSGLPIWRGSSKGELAVYVICNCLSRALWWACFAHLAL